MAEIMAYEGENDEYLSNKGWYFKDGLDRFKREKGRWPKLADIMPDTDGYLSVYSYGQAFWHFMKTNHTDYKTIKDFFVSGLDWDVFDISYEEIDDGYIQYLKSLAGITSVEERENNSFNLWFSNNDLLIQNTNQIGNIDVEIFAVTGQLLFQGKTGIMPNEKNSISLNSLSANRFYIVRLKSKHEVFVQKLYKLY